MKKIPLSNINIYEVKNNEQKDSGRYSWGHDEMHVDSIKLRKLAYLSYQAHELAAEILGFSSSEEMDNSIRDFD